MAASVVLPHGVGEADSAPQIGNEGRVKKKKESDGLNGSKTLR